MITKFEALVSRESLAVVFTGDDQMVTVVKVRMKRGTWTALVQYSDGSRAYALLSSLTPSRHLLTLIKKGTYREDSMSWHSVIGLTAERVTQPLHY